MEIGENLGNEDLAKTRKVFNIYNVKNVNGVLKKLRTWLGMTFIREPLLVSEA